MQLSASDFRPGRLAALAVFSALLVLPLTRPLAAQGPVIDGEPLILVIDPRTGKLDHEPQELLSAADLAKRFGEGAGGNPERVVIHWANFHATEPLAQFRGEEKLTFGSSGSSAIQFVADREPISGSPGAKRPKISLKANNPSTFKAGVYTGFLLTDMKMPLLPSAKLTYRWPVVVCVRGLRILDMKFSEAAAVGGTPLLRVGDAASVQVTLEAIGSSIAGGELELRTRDTRQSKQANFRIPLPLKKPIDPLKQSANKATLLEMPEYWRNVVLRTRFLDVVKDTFTYRKELAARMDASFRQVRTIEALLPRLTHVGDVQATVRWNAEQTADKQAKVWELQQETPWVKIDSGLWIGQRYAVVGERLGMAFVAAKKVGSSVDLSVSEVPAGKSQTIKLLLRNEGPRGAVYTPKKNLPIGTTGDFSLAISKPAAAAKTPTRRMSVLFDSANQLQKPLLIFRDRPPFFLTAWLMRDDDLTKCGANMREKAIQLASVRGAKNVELHFQGVHIPGRPQLLEPAGGAAEHPELSLQQGEAKAAGKGAPKTPPPALWKLEDSKKVGVNLLANIRTGPDKKYVGPRAAIGTRTYLLRFALIGSAPDGSPLQRVYEVPFNIIVRSPWYYDFWVLMCAILLGLIALSLVWVRVRQSQRYRAAQRQHVVDLDGGEPEPTPAPGGDTTPGLLPEGGAASRSPAASAEEAGDPSAASSEPPPMLPPEGDDDGGGNLLPG